VGLAKPLRLFRYLVVEDLTAATNGKCTGLEGSYLGGGRDPSAILAPAFAAEQEGPLRWGRPLSLLPG